MYIMSNRMRGFVIRMAKAFAGFVGFISPSLGNMATGQIVVQNRTEVIAPRTEFGCNYLPLVGLVFSAAMIVSSR